MTRSHARRYCQLSWRRSPLSLAAARARSRSTPERIVRAADEPENWLTYSGAYSSQRHTALRQITPQNVRNLEQQWVLQGQVLGAWQSSPLVVDGIMYLTQRPNDVLALDAETGRVFWQYRYNNSADQRVCCGANNRGLAIHGDTLVHGHARRASRSPSMRATANRFGKQWLPTRSSRTP